ncbi:transporter, dicarboxylate/amino acid:cation Na+/H+ symporter family protein [Clostridium celatum DSM 1785]|uniref:Transporter, dicarboxylate/amino acid:cation Na+/H+ symporter family protein n=2 Tax=Clostridium celatum TaxID=36834 RepID=L1QHA4_9CLOT|nr:transporter, dicarboxylate/amino acid:cation Na+/H+ symporter family protein [Clostridium celatum DSM 1785]
MVYIKFVVRIHMYSIQRQQIDKKYKCILRGYKYMRGLSMRKISLITRIFLCLILGISIGLICGNNDIDFPVRILATFSGLFGNFLSFVIPLIIIGFIVPGIACLGGKSGKGLIITTVIAYISTIGAGFAAYLIGSNILPRFINGSVLLGEGGKEIQPYFSIEIPVIMSVMSALVLAFILGIGLSKIKNSAMLKMVGEFNSIVLMIVTKVLIPLVPIYIGCVFAKLSYSGEIFNTLKSFGLVYVILFSLQLAYILLQYCIAGAVKSENPFKLIKNMIPSYMTAVGTQSSAATIPVTLACVKKNNVSEEVLDFVVPLGATIHLAGDTITLVLTSMAVMYMNGQVPTFGMIMPFILMLGVTMIAAPGVPGGGVMAALGLLESMLGFGTLEKPLMIALHAAQDSFGTATNVTGDGAIAILVDYIINRKNNKSKSKDTIVA